MDQVLIKRYAFITMVLLCLLSSCSSHEKLIFANREWHISDHYGQIIDKDTTYRMTFGNVLIPDPLAIVSSDDSVAKYPGMDRFLSDILHTAHLDNAEILFYAPQMQTIFVRPKHDALPMKPSSISVSMHDNYPYTMWVQEDDVENWIRKPSEMYTFTYFNKKRKQLLIVDCYDYGEEPIAQITVFQSKNGCNTKMKVPDHIKRAYWYRDMKYFMRDIEFWSHQVDGHRQNAFENYKIGRDIKNNKK